MSNALKVLIKDRNTNQKYNKNANKAQFSSGNIPFNVTTPDDECTSGDKEDSPDNKIIYLAELLEVYRKFSSSFTPETKNSKKIDYILTFSLNTENEKLQEHENYRRIYFDNLKNEGLELEVVPEVYQSSQKKTIMFVKVFVPWEILLLYADLLKMKLPIKGKRMKKGESFWDMPFEKYLFFRKVKEICRPVADCECSVYTAAFRREFKEKFDLSDENIFSDSMRFCIALEILQRARFGEEPSEIGLNKIIATGAIEEAYPLHQGPWSIPKDTDEPLNDRMWLYQNWAQPRAFYRFQPLQRISKYCGSKVAIYFAYLGFYTSWLFPVSILSIITFFYGITKLVSNQVSLDICDKTRLGKTILCPPCDDVCDYQYLHKNCIYAKCNAVLENKSLIFFTIVMSCWAKLFLEYWTRKQRELQFRWDLNNISEKEGIRPEFEAQCVCKRTSPITGEKESYMTKKEKSIRYFVSSTTVLCLVVLWVFLFFLLVVCRIVLGNELQRHMETTPAKLLTSVILAIVYLIVIIIFSSIYRLISLKLTEWERPRTENEFDNRFTFKMFCFYFFSHYLSIFYIAFFKPSLYGAPNSHNYLLPSVRAEECSPTGCLFDVTVEMAILFCGKQFVLNMWEITGPIVRNFLRRRRFLGLNPEIDSKKAGSKIIPQWEIDYRLCPFSRENLYFEYLEIVIQFGFVVLFVSAFPLAPVFAFLNNVLEIRIDALKVITQFRRTARFRARDIGIWMDILKVIATIGIVCNSFIIGYTSDFIPKFVYRFFYSPNDSLDGFVTFSLSEFSVKDFKIHSIPLSSKLSPEFANVTTCFYPAYRESYKSEIKYEFSKIFWVISFSRLVFIIAYQHVILILTQLISYFVTEVSKAVKIELKREEYLNQELYLGYNKGLTNKDSHSTPDKS